MFIIFMRVWRKLKLHPINDTRVTRGYPIQSLPSPAPSYSTSSRSPHSTSSVSLESGSRHDHGQNGEVSGIYRHFQVRFGIFNYTVHLPRLVYSKDDNMSLPW